MPEWLMGGAIGLFGAGAAWGAMSWRVSRVERDVESKISRELYSEALRVINLKLDKLELGMERANEKLDERTGPHRKLRSHEDE